MIVLASFTVYQNIQFNEESRHITECQVEFVERFAEALNTRTEANEQGRVALDELIRKIVETPDGEATRQALRDYIEVRNASEEARRANPYPEVTISEECLP